MRITRARSAGFCVGVKRAIDTALRAADGTRTICMLGDIVHNEGVVARVKKRGIRKIRRLGRGAGKTLLIRAHGAPSSVYRRARARGYRIIDATCPMVKEIHRLAREEERRDRTVIIIGDRKHDEVRGIQGALTKRPVVIDPKEPLPLQKLRPLRRASILVQSTQNTGAVDRVITAIAGLVQDLRVHNTICTPTKKRQHEARTLPRRNDAIVVIGSRTSANTKRLYEIARSLNPKTCWIDSARGLRKGFFRGVKSVGVMAGASTPDETIADVISALKKL